MTRTEERLRSAFADAAATVRPETLRPLTLAAPDRSRRTRWIVPLVAAASAGVLVAGVATLRGTETGPARPSATSLPPPDLSALTSPRVRAATRGVLKVTTGARRCGTKAEGTGFVYAPQRVMTTAHTVSGSRDPVEVSISGGRRYQARVVLYDPRRDVAVLAVPGLRAPTLTFNSAGRSRAAAVIAGYPPHAAVLMANPARIRARQIASGPDIYRSPSPVRREIFALLANVPDGRSGAPLLAADGTVYGMLFAAALDADDTAYALTAQELAQDAQAGRTAEKAVSSPGCSRI
jgi:S1-C subfamily serine protease